MVVSLPTPSVSSEASCHVSHAYSVISIDSIFEDYTITSAADKNTINLELPLPPLQRALRSAINASYASLRLTKKDGIPVLSLTITTNASSNQPASTFGTHDPFAEDEFAEESLNMQPGRETIVTQNIPIRVLTADTVALIHEPRCREPDVHLLLPSLLQLKAISDRFTKLALATTTTTSRMTSSQVPKLELSANMHGSLKLRISTDALNIESEWKGLTNPDLDPAQYEDLDEEHPSARMKAAGPSAYATVRIDGKDWSKVLSVGRMGGRVIACTFSKLDTFACTPVYILMCHKPGFINDHALILYVYLSNTEINSEDVLTVSFYPKHCHYGNIL